MERWCRHWYGRARRLVAEADRLLGADRWVEACAAYLRAVELCALCLRDRLAAADLRSVDELSAASFQAAVPLLPHRVSAVRATLLDTEISGYLIVPATAAPAAGVTGIVYVTDLHETPETCYGPVALPVLELGLTCLVVTVRPDPATLPPEARAVLERWLQHPPGSTDALVRL